MSHSTVLVIGPTTIEEVELALAPFDENTTVPRYIEATRAEQIADYRKDLAVAAENLRKYQAGEPPYDQPVNPRHIRWIEVEAPQADGLSDDQLWEQKIVTDRRERDEQGNVWSTWNPKARWDWYVIGGRWDGGLVTTEPVVEAQRMDPGEYPVSAMASEHREPCDWRHTNFVPALSMLDREQTRATLAVLTPDGEWHEGGLVGWFGVVTDETDGWPEQWAALVDAHPAQPAWLVDVHI